MTPLTLPLDIHSPALRALAPETVLDRWAALDRATHEPRVVVATAADGSWSGAALTTARPSTAYLKIVDAVGDTASAVAAVIVQARARGDVQVKWEGWSVDDAIALALGFDRLRAPLATAGASDQPPGGYVRWLDDVAPDEPVYYRQSTNFSCGAVTALIAQASHDEHAPFDRTAELSLWREATNFNACEPFGLAVAVQRSWPETAVSVALDTDRPVLVDHLDEAEASWRALLQQTSRSQAAELGMPVSRERLSIRDLRTAVEAGERVLLLVSLARMQGFDVPHWVLAHGTVSGAVVIEDPWFTPAVGDTWVDAHLLPIADAALDDMARIEHDGFRGAVRLSAS